MSAAALNSLTRSALGALVDREERRTGSRTVAYQSVAQAVGASSSWVRKFLAGSDEVKEPRITLFQRIRANYEHLCSRIEQENRDDERKLMLIRGEIDAVTEGFGEETRRQDEARLGDS